MQAKLREHALSSGEARAKALRPTVRAGVGGAGVLQRYGPSHSDGEGAPRRLGVAFAARDGDYADPQTSEESPRIMARRRGRRARCRPAPHWVLLLSTPPTSLDRDGSSRRAVTPNGDRHARETPTPPTPAAGGQDAKLFLTHPAVHLSHRDADDARTQSRAHTSRRAPRTPSPAA